MKRKLLLCLSLLLLTGCAGEASMTLTPKKLKTQTENVLHILNWNGKFYDFQERANQAGNLPNVESDKGWSMGANRHARGADAREKQGKLRTFRRE